MTARVTGKRLALFNRRDAVALQAILDRVQPGAVIAVAIDRHIADSTPHVGRARALVRAGDMLARHYNRLADDHNFLTLGRGDLRRRLPEPILPTVKVGSIKGRRDD